MDAGSSDTQLPSTPAPPLDVRRFTPGFIVADRYRIVALAGRGGMGEVYRADDQRIGQTVALKFLPVSLEHDATARERLIAEVRNARTISHPNICRVYDIAETRGRYFLTMEYIDGEDLGSLLRRIGRLPAPKALEIARQLCAGLGAAHDRGVLHRDLKPANVMIDGRGQARITDFGLAVEAGPATSPADTSGTISYMAPERFAGHPATVQSDLYALGLILYETYTGKAAFKASSVGDWQRAHRESTPTSPSALVSDIEPAVERVVLRCLEKDPARRPASAARVAGALPGGDPLAAALAAGETPSPELVAASGEEGTLPRARAWRWFAACLASLALGLPLGSVCSLTELVPARDPLLLQETARQLLKDVGYDRAPRDSAWWYRVDPDSMKRLINATPPGRRFAPSADLPQGPIVFCYRQSSASLFSFSTYGDVDDSDPQPRRFDDAVVELGPEGGLVSFRAGGTAFGWARPPRTGDPPWSRMFEAAGLTQREFHDVTPKWTPIFGYDANVAWEGRRNGEAIRVEGAAYRGRPVEFRVLRAALEPAVWDDANGGWPKWFGDIFFLVLLVASLAVPAVVARRNAREGRGDRKGTIRVTIATFAAGVTVLFLRRHWTADPKVFVLVPFDLLGPAFWMAGMAGLYYLGLEPHVRRRWPHLLIAWTRLLEGRWRDPLVGRSLLVGTMGALWVMAIIPGLAAAATRGFDWPLAVPRVQGLPAPVAVALANFIADPTTGLIGVLGALFYLAILLMARLATRHDGAAWAVLFVLGTAIPFRLLVRGEPWLWDAPIESLLFAAIAAAFVVGMLRWHGLLATVVMVTLATAVLNTPMTVDLSRWYAWRTVLLAALTVGLAAWGFRNVLGRQTAFPGGAVDG